MMTTKTITIVDLLKNWIFTNPPADDVFHVVITDPQTDGNPVIYDYMPDNIIRVLIERYTDWLFPYCCIQSQFTNYNDPHNTFSDAWIDYKTDNMPNWQRIAHAYNIYYNPIHNYDRNETETYTKTNNHLNSDSYDNYKIKQDVPPLVNTTHSYGNGKTGNDAVDNITNVSLTNTYDGTLVDTTTDKITGSETTTNQYTNDKTTVDTEYTGTHTLSGNNNENLNRNLQINGNIGVTTSAQMLTDELKLRNFDMLDHIIDNFAKKYLFLI